MLRIAYTPAAEKYFRKIKNLELKTAYQHAILAIRRDPTIGMEKTGDLKGIFSFDLHYKGTNYELAYRIYKDENGDLILILLAGTRENFYKELKRYMK